MAFVLQKDAKTTLDGWLQSIIAVYEGSEKQTGYKYANSITHMHEKRWQDRAISWKSEREILMRK